MSQKLYSAIKIAKGTAQDFLKKQNIDTPPVNVKKIVKENFGFDIKEMSLTDDISGLIKRDGKSGSPVIVINKNHNSKRQRFTIAHELGHFLLHQDNVHIDNKNFIKFRDERSSRAEDLEEIQANQFAAEILMPTGLLTQDFLKLREENGDDAMPIIIQKLASLYNVSTEAMTIKVGSLLN